MSKLDSKDCPQPEMLSDFLLGKLDLESSQQCESHLAQCNPCVETISGLNLNDTFMSLVEEVGADSVGSESDREKSIVSNLIHRLANVGTRTNRPVLDANQRAADVIALLAPPTKPEAIGQIDHYRIESVLGCGSTGVVFGAIDENLDRPVAIKVLRPSLGDAARQRFIAEARATANLNHPGIVTIFHVGDTGNVAYIVMQWLPGETLEQRLDRETLLDSSTVKNYGVQIARGLSKAHEKGLIHRDIKPANLWITEDGHVKILDFGLVRIMDESPQLTCTGMIAGTPCFMSPEQSRGDELDGRSDLFSLGCVFYRCLTGKLPFVSSNALATLQAIQRVAPESPKRLEPSVDQDLSDLTMSLLEKSPHRRPDSANDVALAIESPRSEWPFSYESNDAHLTTEPQKLELKPATKPSSIDSFWGRTLTALALGLIGFAAFAFWPQIIRIATNQGEIVIESNDPNVQIEVLDGGQRVEIIDLKTSQSIQIQSGTYQIRALGDKNSVSIDKETLTLSRGETEIVTVKNSASTGVDSLPSNTKDSDSGSHQLIGEISAATPGLGGPVKIQVNHTNGKLDLIGSDEDCATVAKEISKINPNSNGKSVLPVIIPLRYFKSQDLARSLDRVFRRDNKPAVIAAVHAPNALMVFASDVFIEQIQGIVDENEKRAADRGGTVKGSQTAERVNLPRQHATDRSTFLIAKDNPQFPGLSGPVRIAFDAKHKGLSVVGDDNDRAIVSEKITELSSKGDGSTNLEEILSGLANAGKAARTVYSEPVYDGMTFEECHNAVKYERDGDKLRKPCIGLMELSDSESSQAVNKDLLMAVLRIQGIDYNSYSAQRYVRWLTKSQLQELAVESTSGDDDERWRLFRKQFIKQWKRLRPVEDKLIENIVAAVREDSIVEEIPAFTLSNLIEMNQLSKANFKKAIECLSAYAQTSENSRYFFRSIISVHPSWPGLGAAMCDPISRFNRDEIRDWLRRVNELDAENQKAVIRAFAKRVLELEVDSVCTSFLANLPEDLVREFKPVVDEFAATNSKPALNLQYIIRQRRLSLAEPEGAKFNEGAKAVEGERAAEGTKQ